jgi:hypothetical protein
VLNPNGFWQSCHAWATLRTPDKPGSPPAFRTSPLSLYSIKNEIGSTIGTLSWHFFVGRSTGLFIGGLSRCFGRKWGSGGPLVRPVGHLGCLGGQVSLPHRLWALDASCTNLPWHIGKEEFERAPTPGRPAKEVGLASPTLAQLGLGFVPHHPLVSYSLWLCLILDILKICMDFGSYDAFPSSDVPKMVDQQNSWNSLVIGTYLLYLERNVGMLALNICILWPPTVSKNSKVTMSRLLGGVISELVLILLNLYFEIEWSWMNLGRFLNDIHIPTIAKYYPQRNSCLYWAFVKGCVHLSSKNDLLTRKKTYLLASPRNIGVHTSAPEYTSTTDISTTPLSQ